MQIREIIRSAQFRIGSVKQPQVLMGGAKSVG